MKTAMSQLGPFGLFCLLDADATIDLVYFYGSCCAAESDDMASVISLCHDVVTGLELWTSREL